MEENINITNYEKTGKLQRDIEEWIAKHGNVKYDPEYIKQHFPNYKYNRI